MIRLKQNSSFRSMVCIYRRDLFRLVCIRLLQNLPRNGISTTNIFKNIIRSRAINQAAYLRMEYDISKSIHVPDEPPNYQLPNADSDWKQKGDLEERADMALSALKAVLPGALAHGPMVHQYYDWNGHGGHVWTETTPLQFADQDFGPTSFRHSSCSGKLLEAALPNIAKFG